MAKHRVVVVGGGFAGVNVCRQLAGVADIDVTLVDRRNYHLFQPLLYQVATGGLSPGDIAAPLRSIMRKAPNVRVVLGEMRDLDPAAQEIVLVDVDREQRIAYDTLIIATGARHSYLGKPQWEALAPGLKSIEDATQIRARVLYAFEQAEQAPDEATRQAWLTFVVVGAGPTGVELAGALGELARHTMKHEFRSIDPAQAKILLVEFADRVLTPYTPDLSAKAQRSLEQLGVTVMLGTRVVDIHDDHVLVAAPATGERKIPAHTFLWAAGVEASPLGKLLADKAGATLDRQGRVVVQPDCTVKGHPELMVLGDLSHWEHDGPDTKPLPGVAPVAMQMGNYAGKLLRARARGAPVPGPFKYLDKGSMAVIGRNHAVVQMPGGKLRFTGFIAWLAWLFIHILYLVDFENKVLVFTQWAINYVTRHRGARLITPKDLPARIEQEARKVPAPAAAARSA